MGSNYWTNEETLPPQKTPERSASYDKAFAKRKKMLGRRKSEASMDAESRDFFAETPNHYTLLEKDKRKLQIAKRLSDAR
tara:strand:+ start:544 stop:783 length:240 start_codon:yes stop_codon:yes gene_type:complete